MNAHDDSIDSLTPRSHMNSAHLVFSGCKPQLFVERKWRANVGLFAHSNLRGNRGQLDNIEKSDDPLNLFDREDCLRTLWGYVRERRFIQ